MQILTHADALGERHSAVEAVRIGREQAEAARLEAAKLAEEKQRREILLVKGRPRPNFQGRVWDNQLDKVMLAF